MEKEKIEMTTTEEFNIHDKKWQDFISCHFQNCIYEIEKPKEPNEFNRYVKIISTNSFPIEWKQIRLPVDGPETLWTEKEFDMDSYMIDLFWDAMVKVVENKPKWYDINAINDHFTISAREISYDREDLLKKTNLTYHLSWRHNNQLFKAGDIIDISFELTKHDINKINEILDNKNTISFEITDFNEKVSDTLEKASKIREDVNNGLTRSQWHYQMKELKKNDPCMYLKLKVFEATKAGLFSNHKKLENILKVKSPIKK